MTWLPENKRAAVCFSVDDVHPAPIAREALAHVQWLQERHPQLRVTLFTTPDWRTLDPYPTRSLLTRIPILRDRLFTVRTHPRGTFRLDRHEAFCAFLREWQGAEVAMHGLHHVRPGMRPVLEFEGRSRADCRATIEAATRIFEEARLPIAPGMAPPGWHTTPDLLAAMGDCGLTFVASARDLETPVTPDAVANGSGLRGVSLIRPERLRVGIVHFPTNFQATSPIERALAILNCGGLLSIKAHLLAESGSYRALDGLTREYRDLLDRLLCSIEDRFGDDLWWTSMGELARAFPPVSQTKSPLTEESAARSAALECGGLPPLSERAWQDRSESGSKLPHSKARLRRAGSAKDARTMKLRVFPAADADAGEFLRGANLAFGAWGDEAMFDWAFRRVMSGRAADLLYLDDDGVTLAASAVTWRTVVFDDGCTRLAAIMTGSWTLPEARGRGAFTRMIEATRELASEQDALVLGFGRMENASGRRLEAAGAALHPAFYCRSTGGGIEESLEVFEPEPSLFASGHDSRFVYTEAEWRSQFIERPGARVECVGRRGEWAAIVETVGEFDRVHAVSDVARIPLLAARAHAKGRRLFWYTTREQEATGVECTAGFLSIMSSEIEAERRRGTPPGHARRMRALRSPQDETKWHFQNGDRM